MKEWIYSRDAPVLYLGAGIFFFFKHLYLSTLWGVVAGGYNVTGFYYKDDGFHGERRVQSTILTQGGSQELPREAFGDSASA